MIKLISQNAALVVLGLSIAGPAANATEIDFSKLPPPAAAKGVTYGKDIRPLFEASCLRCHGQERPKAGLRLDSLEGALRGSKDGQVIVPGKSEKSALVIAVAQLDPEKSMPPKPRQGRGPGGFNRGAGNGGPPPGGGPGGAEHGGGAPAGGPGGKGGFGPPPKPLTAEQVGLIRAWIDQGAK